MITVMSVAYTEHQPSLYTSTNSPSPAPEPNNIHHLFPSSLYVHQVNHPVSQ